MAKLPGSPRARKAAPRRWESWAQLVAAAVEAARDELRALKAPADPVLMDRWFEHWTALNRRDTAPAHDHVRAMAKAIEAALAYRAKLGKTWDALEGADRQLHEILEEMHAGALVARALGRGGLKLRSAPSRAEIVDLAIRQGESFTVRELALMSLVAGFAPKPSREWETSRNTPAAREPSPADVIGLEVETIRRELDRQKKASPFAKQRSAKELREGRPGRRPKTPT